MKTRLLILVAILFAVSVAMSAPPEGKGKPCNPKKEVCVVDDHKAECAEFDAEGNFTGPLGCYPCEVGYVWLENYKMCVVR